MRKLLVIALFVAASTGISATMQSHAEPLVWGDRDAHGCIGSAGYSWDADTLKCLRSWEKESEFGKAFSVTAKKFNRVGSDFDLSVRYPKTGVASLDSAVVTYVRSAIGEFRAVLSRKGAEESGRYAMFVNYEKSSFRGFASVTVSDYRFTGGAHGNTVYENFNVDLKTGKLLSDSDIFKDPVAARKKIAGLVYAKLVREAEDQLYEDKDEVKRALADDESALKVLRFDRDGLEFQSIPYQVWPYAAGVVTVTVPYSKILDLFTDGIAERLK